MHVIINMQQLTKLNGVMVTLPCDDIIIVRIPLVENDQTYCICLKSVFSNYGFVEVKVIKKKLIVLTGMGKPGSFIHYVTNNTKESVHIDDDAVEYGLIYDGSGTYVIIRHDDQYTNQPWFIYVILYLLVFFASYIYIYYL